MLGWSKIYSKQCFYLNKRDSPSLKNKSTVATRQPQTRKNKAKLVLNLFLKILLKPLLLLVFYNIKILVPRNHIIF